MTRKISDCNIAPSKDCEPKALETPIECEHCHTRIPATVAFSFEGADYIYYFCGPLCLDAWCKATKARDN